MQEKASNPGAIVEIGTHHGKSLVSMFAAQGDTSVACIIDLFGRQEENHDESGRGDLARPKSNLAAFGVSEDRVVIDPRSSFEVTPDDIIDGVGPAGLFHIDGGHQGVAVTNDLRLAIQVLEPDGVLAFDGVFRAEWPEVSMASSEVRRFPRRDSGSSRSDATRRTGADPRRPRPCVRRCLRTVSRGPVSARPA